MAGGEFVHPRRHFTFIPSHSRSTLVADRAFVSFIAEKYHVPDKITLFCLRKEYCLIINDFNRVSTSLRVPSTLERRGMADVGRGWQTQPSAQGWELQPPHPAKIAITPRETPSTTSCCAKHGRRLLVSVNSDNYQASFGGWDIYMAGCGRLHIFRPVTLHPSSHQFSDIQVSSTTLPRPFPSAHTPFPCTYFHPPTPHTHILPLPSLFQSPISFTMQFTLSSLALLATVGLVTAAPQSPPSSAFPAGGPPGGPPGGAGGASGWGATTSSTCATSYPTSINVLTDPVTLTSTTTWWNTSYITTSTPSPVVHTDYSK